jgi:hypothetical protein
VRLVAALTLLVAVASARADENGVVRARLVPDGSAVVREHALPWTPTHHKPGWTTGAIITLTSIGVIAMGAALLVSDWPSDWGKPGAMAIGGMCVGGVGVGGLVIGGPATWVGSMGGDK